VASSGLFGAGVGAFTTGGDVGLDVVVGPGTGVLGPGFGGFGLGGFPPCGGLGGEGA
jgi:hypothetical protein